MAQVSVHDEVHDQNEGSLDPFPIAGHNQIQKKPSQLCNKKSSLSPRRLMHSNLP
ncbi:hypothetical protein M2275_007768 [Rhodococcus opacus]|nr:hypothetical protein [Rhodococcus opacus]